MSITLTRRQLLVLGCALLAALALVGTHLARSGTAQQVQPRPAHALRAAPAPAAMVFVDVVGAVRRPGLYRLRDGARIADAVARAGGPTRHADIALINLAAPVVDGQQITVPRRGVTGAAGPATGAPGAAKVSLSSATVEQLDTLPGVGPVTAQKIVDWRTTHGPFRSVEALDDVPGIGPARIEQLRELVAP